MNEGEYIGERIRWFGRNGELDYDPYAKGMKADPSHRPPDYWMIKQKIYRKTVPDQYGGETEAYSYGKPPAEETLHRWVLENGTWYNLTVLTIKDGFLVGKDRRPIGWEMIPRIEL